MTQELPKWLVPAWEDLNKRMKFVEESAIANLRDFFATSALSVLASGGIDCAEPSEVARFCYEIADAMMKERDKKNV